MRILLPFLLAFFLFACREDPREKIPFPAKYVWKDSILDYKMTHDSIEIYFVRGTAAKRWYFEIEIEKQHIVLFHLSPTSFGIKNNKVKIAINIPDSIPLDSVELGVCGREDAGILFSQNDNGYYLLETVSVFVERNDGHLHLISPQFYRNRKWLIMPDTLIHGKDSIYYQLKMARFINDSMRSPFLPAKDKP